MARDALYKEFRPLVCRLLRQYGSESELRQDLEGEIYTQFCRLYAAYDPLRGVPLRPYLVRQLTAATYTYVRCYWRRQRRELSLEYWAGNLHSDDPSAQWDDRLLMQHLRATLPEALANIPARQRKVIIWRYYEERSYEEIAHTLGIQVATARSLLRHGLNNLRRYMEGIGCRV
jgi:RNA polymerase sigma factor (sigma-70 family)